VIKGKQAMALFHRVLAIGLLTLTGWAQAETPAFLAEREKNFPLPAGAKDDQTFAPVRVATFSN
jgi:hypothetical protein